MKASRSKFTKPMPTGTTGPSRARTETSNTCAEPPMTITHQDELEALRRIGRLVANTMHSMAAAMEPGMTTRELMELAAKFGAATDADPDGTLAMQQGFIRDGKAGAGIEHLADGRSCSIPDDHIDPRRSAFFMARSVLRDIRSGVLAC